MTPTPRKIVFVLPALTAGGAERVLITLMNGLDRAAYAPIFVSVSAQGPLRDLIAPDIPCHILTPAGRVGKSLPRLRACLRRLKPDIVVSTMAHMNFGILLLRPFLPRTRFIVREAITPSFILQDRGMATPLIRALYRILYPRADMVISPAEIIVAEFNDLLGIKTGNHRVLPNPVNLSLIRRDENQPPPRADRNTSADSNAENHDPHRGASGGSDDSLGSDTGHSTSSAARGGRESSRDSEAAYNGGTVHFIAAGRLHTQKGFDRLIAGLPDLPPSMDWHLTILGEGPERPALESLIRDKGLTARISLPGLSAHPWPHYAAADAFLLPSRWEGLPNVVLEALACGTPVIATAESGGIGDIARAAYPGTVTVVPDMESFLHAMAQVKPNPPGNRFRASLLPPVYTPESVAAAFNEILQQVARPRAPAKGAANHS